MDAIETAWLAGLVEGEGWIGAAGTTPGVKVAMTDEDIVARFAALAQVDYRKGPSSDLGTKPVYIAAAYGDKARRLLYAIRPFLGDRRQAQTATALAARSTRPSQIQCRQCGATVQVARTGRTPSVCGQKCRTASRKART